MAAWRHHKYWDFQMYETYRKFVAKEAPTFRGNDKLDCADISVVLLINFAASHGLPTTFWDNNQVRYISKAARQTPKDPRALHTRDWKNKRDYTEAVLRRVGAEALVRHNTVINPRGVERGDLMVKLDHAALVFAVYQPGVIHPRAWAYGKSIPLFPGHEVAKKQLGQTEYFRTPMPDKNVVGPTEVDAPWPHIDYLNHRGFGKEKAELIFYASTHKMTDEGFAFRMYTPGVIDNWIDWDGTNDPPR